MNPKVNFFGKYIYVKPQQDEKELFQCDYFQGLKHRLRELIFTWIQAKTFLLIRLFKIEKQ